MEIYFHFIKIYYCSIRNNCTGSIKCTIQFFFFFDFFLFKLHLMQIESEFFRWFTNLFIRNKQIHFNIPITNSIITFFLKRVFFLKKNLWNYDDYSLYFWIFVHIFLIVFCSYRVWYLMLINQVWTMNSFIR